MEMIVVLAIVAIVMSVAVGVVSRPSDRLLLRQTAAEAALLFQAARAEALAENEEIRVDYDREAGTLASAALGRAVTLPSNMALKLTTARQELRGESLASIRFLPDGRSTGGDVTLANSDHAIRISVDWLTGSVRSEEVTP